jgi:AcrR family transcriptional regulator/predicted DNA-binding transcriptional regulator AlpA
MKNNELMKMSELVRLAGVPASTIRFYIKEGLLPAPVKAGKTSAYYSGSHLERLGYIKQQLTQKKSLAAIKKEMAQRFPESEEEPAGLNGGKPMHRRDEIIRAAIELFLSKGYGDTSIADVAASIRMSKVTFYLHFKNKEELLIACADKIFHAMYASVWHEIGMEQNMLERFRKRARAFLASYPQWLDMMNIIRGLSLSENPVFKAKFDQVLDEIIDPIIHDLDRMQSDGSLRKEIDTTLAGFIVMGMGEFAAELVHKGVCSEQEIFESLEQISLSGLLQK